MQEQSPSRSNFQSSFNIPKLSKLNIIEETRKLVADKSEYERYHIAKHHLFNALDFKTARIDLYQPDAPSFLRFIYNFQTFFLWRRLLLLISYLFMYSAFWGHVRPSNTLIGVEFAFIFFMVIDLLMEIYHKRYNLLRPNTKFMFRFYIKTIAIVLFIVDEIIALSTDTLPIRPFLILRCIPPIVYDPNMRKLVYAILSSYIDIIVYALFYMSVVTAFAIMANQFIEIPPNAEYDQFTDNYGNLGKAIFIIYVLSTFDSYPDNQLIAIRLSTWIYALFILFVFMNVLIFVTIPTNILTNSVREVRSKAVIIDEIEQQHNLIMAFICLGGDNQLSVPYEKVIRFLLFSFNNEVKHLDKITEICRELDEKVNGTIEINEFMQLCKIIQSKKYLRPPRFNLWKKFNPFQSYIDNRLKLKYIIKSVGFQAMSTLIILFTCVNCILTIYLEHNVFTVIDDILMILFFIEVMFKLVGLGPEEFFHKYWNIADLFIAIAGLILELVPEDIFPRNSSVLIKMLRIFRLTILINLISECLKLSYKSPIYRKFTELITQITLLFPVVLKFFPLYMLAYYFLGVLGVQIFRRDDEPTSEDNPYTNYNEFSNFKSLLGTQFIFVQVLTEAGWSMVAFDHALRYGYYALTMLFFVFCHEVIVIIITSLLKGVTWETYNSMRQEIEEIKMKKNFEMYEAAMLKRRMETVEDLKEKIEKHENILPDNMITREIYEKRIDKEIMLKLIELEVKNKNIFYHKKKHSKNLETLKVIEPLQKRYQSFLLADIQNSMKNVNFEPTSTRMVAKNDKIQPTESRLIIESENPLDENIDMIDLPPIPVLKKNETSPNKARHPHPSRELEVNESQRNILGKPEENLENSVSSISTEDLKEEDIEKEMDNILNQIELKSGFSFSLKVEYPPQFLEFLKKRMKPLRIANFKREFNLDKDVFAKKESLNIMVHGLHTLLEMSTSEREHRTYILKTMIKKGLINEENALRMVTEKSEYENEMTFDYNWVIRNTYLTGMPEVKINQFEIEYFSGVYGKSFKEINKSNVYPLLRLEARLTYCFSNLLRYREMSTFEFFNTLTQIENKISVNLLESGSICKFVYQIDTNSETWFTVELKDSNDLRVHFIKNGLWINHEGTKKDEIYVLKDAFYWKGIEERIDRSRCESLMKKFYQSFESLAFCIKDYDKFFTPEPEMQTYNLYSFFRDVESCKRYVSKQLSISKIMLVMLSKEDEREEPIPYELSDLTYDEEQIEAFRKSKIIHSLDETEHEIFQRLRKIQLEDESLISDKIGLPYSYLVNFMMHIREIMIMNEKNFVFHVEKLLNQNFRETEKNQGGFVRRRSSKFL